MMVQRFNRALKVLIIAAVIGIAAAIVFGGTAHAADATLSWTNPTKYTDGTNIAAGALTQTSAIYGKCNAAGNGLLATPAPVTVVIPQPATTKVITGLGAGTWCFAVRAETASAQSVFTPYVSKVIILTPEPPTGLTVADNVAFMAVRQENRFAMVPVGSVPAGTPCDTGNGVVADGRAYYAVPTSAVSWYGSTQPTVALSTCS
jgi:hypothetical protein